MKQSEKLADEELEGKIKVMLLADKKGGSMNPFCFVLAQGL